MADISILILEPNEYSPKALSTYRQVGSVYLGLSPDVDKTKISVLVVRLHHYLNKRFLSQFPKLKNIVSPTTGLTHIDLKNCEQRNIQVLSLNQCSEAIQTITSTSELTIGLMLALLRRIPQAHQDVINDNNWRRDSFRSRQLSRLTLGLVGLGRIGGHIAHYARAFGMTILAYDPYQPPERFIECEAQPHNLVSLLKASDIVSLHASLRADNRNLLSAEELSHMHSNALLVNTARGALLDEAAAANYLRRGQLGGIAVDVLEAEHGTVDWQDSPLIRAAQDGLNVIVTPHIGGCTSDAMAITEERLAELFTQRMASRSI